MFIFVVMFISCLVYLFNLVLLIIEAVAANESDSCIGAVTHILYLSSMSGEVFRPAHPLGGEKPEQS